jgi:hypothetical protein
VAARLVAYLITGAILGAAAMAVTIAAGVPWLSARDAPLELLDAGDYLSLTAQGIAAAALSRAIAVGIGAVVRNRSPPSSARSSTCSSSNAWSASSPHASPPSRSAGPRAR